VKKVFLFFLFICFVGALVVNQVQALGIVADDPEEQMDTWSENEIAKISRGSVRPGLGKGAVVEYFGDAHKKILVWQAKESGYTVEETAALIAKAEADKKSLGGIKALENFYTALDKKRSEKEQALAQEISNLKEQIAGLQKPATPATAAYVTADDLNNKLGEFKTQLVAEIKNVLQPSVAPAATTTPAEDPLAIAKEARDLAKEARDLARGANDGVTQVSARLDEMDAAWSETIAKTHEAIRKVDRKVIKTNARVENLQEAQTYLSSSNPKERKKGLGLLYLARGDSLPTDDLKEAKKQSSNLKLPRVLDKDVDISKEVLPGEKKDSAPAGEKKSDCE